MFLLYFAFILPMIIVAELPEDCKDRHPSFCYIDCMWDHEAQLCVKSNSTLTPYRRRNCATKEGYTCESRYREDNRHYEACTDYDQGRKEFWCYHTSSWLGYRWDYCIEDKDCTPIMNGEEWSCYQFVHFPDGFTYDFGGNEYCGFNDNHFYPDCDPQVPPEVYFYSSTSSLGKVDMADTFRDSSNKKVIQKVQKELQKKDSHLIFLVHGFWNSGIKEEWLHDLKRATIKRYADKNVIIGIVDWGWAASKHLSLTGGYSGQPRSLLKGVTCYSKQDTSLFGWGVNQGYRRSSSNAMIIGAHVAKLAKVLDAPATHCIGHSLGAHVCGYLGKDLYGGLDSIIGLDPAGPIFRDNTPSAKLSKNDAKFVQVIHTDDGLYGHEDPLGHVDFYLNGGEDQGCSHTCSHQRAFLWLTEIYQERKICQSSARIGGLEDKDYSPIVGDIFAKSGPNNGNFLITENDC